MTNEINIIEKLSRKYSEKPIIQALLQIIPWWGVADTLLQRRAEEIRSERMDVFLMN